MQTDVRPEQGSRPPKPLRSGVRATVRHATPPPVLASEALRDELAPLEPARRASRYWDAGLSAAFALIGLAYLEGWGGAGELAQSRAQVCFAAAFVMATTAVVPLRYLARALVGTLVGLAVIAVGLRGEGPLAELAVPGISTRATEGWRVAAATLLPAALLFRSHYRAFGAGRILLAGAFTLSLPFAVHSGAILLRGPAIVPRVGAAFGLSVVISSLFAFAEAPTISLSAWWSELSTVGIGVAVALRYFYVEPPAGSGPLVYPLTALAFVLAASPMALGLFQVLACLYAHEARRVDVHAPPKDDSRSGQTE